MVRKVFYSFHYQPDGWRASQVRNIGVVEGNQPASDNDWESIKRGGDAAIKRWIDGQLQGRTCTVVLIGSATAGRKWINYEIIESWNRGKGVVGIYIHNLKDRLGKQSTKGANPFSSIYFDRDQTSLSSVANVYDPPYSNSTDVYKHITDSLEDWIEEAIKIRETH